MKAFFQASLVAFAAGSAFVTSSHTAFAAGEVCINDIDCPGGGKVCGGDVCNWTKSQPGGFTCNAPLVDDLDGDPKKDGWCTTDDDCKCKAEGATCKAPYCTFTKPKDGGTAGSAAGGSSAGGSAAGGSSASGSSAGGSSSTAGTSTSGAGPAGAGSPAAPASGDSGGCSMAAPLGRGGTTALAFAALGLGFAISRRRR